MSNKNLFYFGKSPRERLEIALKKFLKIEK
jgi:hypothetical protein